MDAAYANKVELQAKVDSMDEEIKFLKGLYEIVSKNLQSILPGEASQYSFVGPGRDTEGLHLLFQPCEALQSPSSE